MAKYHEKLLNFSKAAKKYDINNELYTAECLFVKGEKSNYIDKEGEKAIMKYFCNADILKMNGVGHWCHSENLFKFVKTVDKFMGLNDVWEIYLFIFSFIFVHTFYLAKINIIWYIYYLRTVIAS